MHRFTPLLALVLLLGSALSAAERPNIVWLLSEDNSKHWLRLYDESGAPTPHIERLAKEGLVFDHAFSNSPVCSVARTTLMTGCLAPRIGTQFHRRSRLARLPDGLKMFPAYMREAGYWTSNRQKKDYNAIEDPGVWDRSSRKATWREREPGQPFFHMQSFGTTHEGSLHFPAEHVVKKPTETDPKTVQLAPYHPDTPTFRYTYARYLDNVRKMDAQIGAVVDALREDGLLEDTFIFYFGDHGGVLPRGKGYIYESGLHVPLVLRIPEKWKSLVGAKRGSRERGFVSFVDFAPTVLELAGLDVPKGMDGHAFLGAEVDPAERSRRDEAFGYADRFDEKYDFVRSLRKGRFKYLRSYQPFNFDGLQNNYRYKMAAYAEWRQLFLAGKLDPVQSQFFLPRSPEALYDVVSDPHEVKNLAQDPEHRRTLLDLRARLSARVKALPDLSFLPESLLVDKALPDAAEYGRSHARDVAALVDLADASLQPFDAARVSIEAGLASENPWLRYQAVITASCHGEAARPLVSRVRSLLAKDPERLVRVRAAEMLALLGKAPEQKNIVDAITRALEESRSGVEACLILNTLVLLRDGPPRLEFSIDPKRLHDTVRESKEVQRRLSYLAAP